MAKSPHILIVDDHQEIRDLLAKFLTKHGMRVSTAPDGRTMHKIMEASGIDLIVLDLMLPGVDGLTLCRDLRSRSKIPVVMLTALGEETDRVVGLEMGADDYIAKPFSARELLARIKAVLRRTREIPESAPPAGQSFAEFEGWTFDIGRRELISADKVVVPLSSGEFDLLLTFVQHAQQVLSRDQLLDLARGRTAVAFDRSIDTQVSRLRRKIEADTRDPKIVKTVWGGGYVFTPTVVFR